MGSNENVFFHFVVFDGLHDMNAEPETLQEAVRAWHGRAAGATGTSTCGHGTSEPAMSTKEATRLLRRLRERGLTRPAHGWIR